jgi:UDPglucose 6-dehydrogenase
MSINARKVANKHIVIGCTVIPGYIEGVGKYLIQDCVNTSLSYHPEFIAQGDIMNGTLRPDMALIGEGSKAAGDVLEEMNLRMTQTKPIICRMSPSSAEITKLSINCFVTMKVFLSSQPASIFCKFNHSHIRISSQVSYANMIGDIADRTPGASKHDILNAVGSDSRVGKKCVSLLVPELELIVFSLQVLASWLWFRWPLLPSRQPCVGRLRQDGWCAAFAP